MAVSHAGCDDVTRRMEFIRLGDAILSDMEVDVSRILHRLRGCVDHDHSFLVTSCYYGNSTIARMLCEAGLDVNVDYKKECPAVLASRRLDVSLLRVLARYGAVLHQGCLSAFVSMINSIGQPLIPEAIDDMYDCLLLMVEDGSCRVDAAVLAQMRKQRFRIAMNTDGRNRMIIEWAVSRHTNPTKLKALAKSVIRSAVRAPQFHSMKQLPIPKLLKAELLRRHMKDVDYIEPTPSSHAPSRLPTNILKYGPTSLLLKKPATVSTVTSLHVKSYIEHTPSSPARSKLRTNNRKYGPRSRLLKKPATVSTVTSPHAKS